MRISLSVPFLFLAVVFLAVSVDAEAAKKRRRRNYGPPPTNPVVLWARTLTTSQDHEQRRKAAFKMSQYSLLIYQDEAVRALTKCVSDTDFEIKVLCTKAMGRTGARGHAEAIRKTLLERYQADPQLRNTIVRAVMTRKDDSSIVHDTFLESLKKSTDVDESLTLLTYFEAFGNGSKAFTESLINVYNKTENLKVKTATISALSGKAEGQESVLAILAQCAENHDSLETPLVLTCLSGLQLQAKKDGRTWKAVEKTLESDDSDVLMASLDVVNALPETPNALVAGMLISMINDVEEEDMLEKAVLALGVAGDHSETIVNTLKELMDKKKVGEGVRIASALVLGLQADVYPEGAKTSLLKCVKEERSQSLRTACQLGLNDIQSRAAKSPETKVADPERGTATPKDNSKN